MNPLRRVLDFFRGSRGTPLETSRPGGASSSVEDVRTSAREDGELILNLWYVTGGMVIRSLRGRAYVASGGDDEKLRFLKTRADRDFGEAAVFPVPDRMKAEVIIAGIGTVRACTQDSVEFLGGYPALFRDVIASFADRRNFPGVRFDSSQALLCITGLVEDERGGLSVRIDRTQQL